jgi:hypothetical protein
MTFVESLGVVGSIASLVGLVVTLYVAWTVRNLRHLYVRQGMLEACLGKLQAHQKNLSRPSAPKNATAIRESLTQIKIIVERIAVYTPKNATIEWRLDQVDEQEKSGVSSPNGLSVSNSTSKKSDGRNDNRNVLGCGNRSGDRVDRIW